MQATAPSLSNLPNELLLQILAHNVPTKLRSRDDYATFMRQHAVSKRLLRLAHDAFFHNLTHEIDLCCILNHVSRTKVYTQVHTEGILLGRHSFCVQVRKLNIRLHAYYWESIPFAVKELEGVLKRYERLTSLRVGVSTQSWTVAAELGGKIEGILEALEMPGLSRQVQLFVMGHRLSESPSIAAP